MMAIELMTLEDAEKLCKSHGYVAVVLFGFDFSTDGMDAASISYGTSDGTASLAMTLRDAMANAIATPGTIEKVGDDE